MVLQVFEDGADPIFAGVANLVAQLCSGFLCKSLLSLGRVPRETGRTLRLENRSVAIIFQIICELQVKAHPVPQVNYGLGDFFKARN